ncbi:hypothetical protein NKJ28_00420 [Mesorhizobium sp. M0145]|uniref:SGNH/GDSL hydrolase family protein n=1 Tax=Mesorhizobium sp. M0145 TaxID=2956895 RepID=UPI00333CB56B
MTVEAEIAALTTAVNTLTGAVDVRKATLDGAVSDAEGFAGEADDAKNAAGVSETNAGTSAAAALASKNAAGVSETNAGTSAAAALTSKNAAGASETAALTSKNAAGVSETNAGSSAAAALASKNAAGVSETNAGSSAAAALASKNAAGVSETNSGTKAVLAQAWAEGTLPAGAGTKSSKEWSDQAAALFAGGYTASTIPATTATGIKALNTATFPVAYRTDAGKAGFYNWDATVDNDMARADANEIKFISPNLAVDGAYVRVALGDAEKAVINRALNERPFEGWPLILSPQNRFRCQRSKLEIGKPININSSSENLADAHYGKTGVTIGSDTMQWEGITLQRVTGADVFTDTISDLRAADYALVAGKRYIASIVACAPFDGVDVSGFTSGPRRFMWMRSIANGTSVYGHGAKMIGREPRRVHAVVQALTTTTYDTLSDPAIALGTGTGTFRWFYHGYGLGGTLAGGDLYLGGVQLEEAPNQTEKCGIAVIGTSIETGTSSLLHPTSDRSWPRYLEGLLCVPIFNGAIGGQSSTTLEARFDTDVAPWGVNAKYCILAANVNDFATGFDSALYRANWLSMYNKAIAAGMIPIFVTPARRSLYNYSNGPADMQAEIDYIKQTYPMVIDRDEVLADCFSTGLLNDQYNTSDGIHPTQKGLRAFAFMVAKKYGHFFHFDNVPSAYQKTDYDDSKVANLPGTAYVEAWDASVFDAAAASINLRDNLAARAPFLIFNGTPGSTKTFQLTAPNYWGGGTPAGQVKSWKVWNATTDGSNVAIQLYKIVAGVATAYGSAVIIPNGACFEIITDGSTSVTAARLQGAALSVLGVTGNAVANYADMVAGTDGHVLRRVGTTLGFGQIVAAGITDATITLTKMAAAAIATAANYWAMTAGKIVTTDALVAANAEQALADATTIAWDMALGINWTVTLAGNRTLGNPTNCIVGRRGRIRVVQDGTGTRTLTKSSNLKTVGGAALVLSTAPGAVDYLDYDCRSATDIRLTPSAAWS